MLGKHGEWGISARGRAARRRAAGSGAVRAPGPAGCRDRLICGPNLSLSLWNVSTSCSPIVPPRRLRAGGERSVAGASDRHSRRRYFHVAAGGKPGGAHPAGSDRRTGTRPGLVATIASHACPAASLRSRPRAGGGYGSLRTFGRPGLCRRRGREHDHGRAGWGMGLPAICPRPRLRPSGRKGATRAARAVEHARKADRRPLGVPPDAAGRGEAGSGFAVAAARPCPPKHSAAARSHSAAR